MTLRMLISVRYLFFSPIANTYVFFVISSVISLLAYFLGTALHPGFSLRFLSLLIAYFRFLGFRVIIFIDDLILIVSSYDECLQQLEVLKQTLCELGFTVNVEKSQLVPVNEILYLGFIINSIAMRLQLPVVKLEKIVSACRALLAKHQPSVRDLAKITGLLVSALPAVNYLEMHYRS